jgi:hypothetical protein
VVHFYVRPGLSGVRVTFDAHHLESHASAMGFMRNLKQPWLFIYYAMAFGLVSYFIDRDVAWAVVAGLIFASAMSAFMALRKRRTDSR